MLKVGAENVNTPNLGIYTALPDLIYLARYIPVIF